MATLTITVPDPVVPRVQAAIGSLITSAPGAGPLRDATSEEVRQFLVDHLEFTVLKEERRIASRAAEEAVTGVGVT